MNTIHAVNTFSNTIQEKIPDMQPTLDAISTITASVQMPSINLPSDPIQNIRQMSSSLSEIGIIQNQIFTLLDFPAVQPEITKKQLKHRIENMSEESRSELKEVLQDAAKKVIHHCKKGAPKIIKAFLIEMSIDAIADLIQYFSTLLKQ